MQRALCRQTHYPDHLLYCKMTTKHAIYSGITYKHNMYFVYFIYLCIYVCNVLYMCNNTFIYSFLTQPCFYCEFLSVHAILFSNASVMY